MFGLFEGDTNRKPIDVGVCTGPNSFGHTVLERIDGLGEAFVMDAPAYAPSDTNMGSDPIAAAQLAPMAKGEWHSQVSEQLVDARNGAINVASLGGSGLLAAEFADYPRKVIRPVLNVVVGSHRLAAINDGPQPVEAVTAALTYPRLQRGTVLLSNRATQEGYDAVPTQVAEFIATLARQDLNDLETGFFTGYHTSIPASGAEDQFRVGTLLSAAEHEGTLWFDPEDYLWWRSAEEVPPFDESSTALMFALLPEGYKRAAVHSSNALIETKFIPGLEQGHLVVLKALSQEWIDELRRGPEWLRRQVVDGADGGGNQFASRWAGLVEKQGLRGGPVAALDDFCERYHP